MPLLAAHPLALQQLPEAPGLFRIRREREDKPLLVEHAPRGVRQAVDRLARQVRLPVPPATGSSVAARLWSEHRKSGIGFQVSGAVADGPRLRKG